MTRMILLVYLCLIHCLTIHCNEKTNTTSVYADRLQEEDYDGNRVKINATGTGEFPSWFKRWLMDNNDSSGHVPHQYQTTEQPNGTDPALYKCNSEGWLIDRDILVELETALSKQKLSLVKFDISLNFSDSTESSQGNYVFHWALDAKGTWIHKILTCDIGLPVTFGMFRDQVYTFTYVILYDYINFVSYIVTELLINPESAGPPLFLFVASLGTMIKASSGFYDEYAQLFYLTIQVASKVHHELTEILDNSKSLSRLKLHHWTGYNYLLEKAATCLTTETDVVSDHRNFQKRLFSLLTYTDSDEPTIDIKLFWAMVDKYKPIPYVVFSKIVIKYILPLAFISSVVWTAFGALEIIDFAVASSRSFFTIALAFGSVVLLARSSPASGLCENDTLKRKYQLDVLAYVLYGRVYHATKDSPETTDNENYVKVHPKVKDQAVQCSLGGMADLGDSNTTLSQDRFASVTTPKDLSDDDSMIANPNPHQGKDRVAHLAAPEDLSDDDSIITEQALLMPNSSYTERSPSCHVALNPPYHRHGNKIKKKTRRSAFLDTKKQFPVVAATLHYGSNAGSEADGSERQIPPKKLNKDQLTRKGKASSDYTTEKTKMWIPEFGLTEKDKDIILGKHHETPWLCDKVIDASSEIIQYQYKVSGLQSCCLGATQPKLFRKEYGKWYQIINTNTSGGGSHWVLLYTKGITNKTGEIPIIYFYDSLRTGFISGSVTDIWSRVR
ncbi:uncharacterized protein [Amphiura filiformis]|uniref:uncharacterized protein n=1 Tax=Amphiura filiformis TaxID=82378 RepID=UPI003B21712C